MAYRRCNLGDFVRKCRGLKYPERIECLRRAFKEYWACVKGRR